MQIVQINEKVMIDTVMLFREHGLGDVDKENVNISRIAKLCSNNWGLWKTVTVNLKKVASYAQAFLVLEEEHKKDVDGKITFLLRTIESQPKSVK